MKKAVILHGTQGSPEGNWFRWLEAELQNRGLEVWLPQLPHAQQPSLSEWLGYIKDNSPFELDEDTLIIGHSSGAILALLISQKGSATLGEVVCVSVFHDNALGWDANAKLFDVEFNWDSIRAHVERQIVCIHSDDDPYVPLDQAQFVANNIGAEMIVIQNQGHFNLEKSKTYHEFPVLLSLLEERRLV